MDPVQKSPFGYGNPGLDLAQSLYSKMPGDIGDGRVLNVILHPGITVGFHEVDPF